MIGYDLAIAFVVAASVLLFAAWIYLYHDWRRSS